MKVCRETEASFTRAVCQLARLHGWLVHHTLPGRVASGRYITPLLGDSGLPDLVLVRGGILVVAELKVGKNRPTDNQVRWLDGFRACPGVRVYVWRPEDWDEIKVTLE